MIPQPRQPLAVFQLALSLDQQPSSGDGMFQAAFKGGFAGGMLGLNSRRQIDQ